MVSLRKIIFGIMLICIAASIVYIANADINDAKTKKSVIDIDGDTEGTSLVTLTVNRESHEFVMYRRGIGECRTMGISHWPGCKYCEHNRIN